MANEYIDKVEVGAKIQTMYIRREMDYGGENDFCRGMRKALRIIENTPSADAQPVKRGTWEQLVSRQSGLHYEVGAHCSCCNEHTVTLCICEVMPFEFCPHCGADMRGAENE